MGKLQKRSVTFHLHPKCKDGCIIGAAHHAPWERVPSQAGVDLISMDAGPCIEMRSAYIRAGENDLE